MLRMCSNCSCINTAAGISRPFSSSSSSSPSPSSPHPLVSPAFASSRPLLLHHRVACNSNGKKPSSRVLAQACASTGKDAGASNLQDMESYQSQQQTSARTQLDLLEKLTSTRDRDAERLTIADQLASKASGQDEPSNATVPLGKKVPMEYSDLTVSQKRNIRRQQYLDQVSKRNDTPFFATVALFVILPPAVILGVAVATGYVDLLP